MVLVDRKKEGLIGRIENKAGMKFERIGAPQPADMARVAAARASTAIKVPSTLMEAVTVPAAAYPPMHSIPTHVFLRVVPTS